MERRLIACCIAGILLGMVVVSLPLTAMVYRTDITSEQGEFYRETPPEVTGSRAGFGGSFLGVATGIGLIVLLGLVLASSVFIILKRYIRGEG